jgi:hypothetical protein
MGRIHNGRTVWELCAVIRRLDAAGALQTGSRVALLDAGDDYLATYLAAKGVSLTLFEPGVHSAARRADTIAEHLDTAGEVPANDEALKDPLVRTMHELILDQPTFAERVTVTRLSPSVSFATARIDLLRELSHVSGRKRARTPLDRFDAVVSLRMAARLGPLCAERLADTLSATSVALLRAGGIAVHTLEVVVGHAAGLFDATKPRTRTATCRYRLQEVEEAIERLAAVGVTAKARHTAVVGGCDGSFKAFDPRHAAAELATLSHPTAAMQRFERVMAARERARVLFRTHYPENTQRAAEVDPRTGEIVTTMILQVTQSGVPVSRTPPSLEKDGHGAYADLSPAMRYFRPASGAPMRLPRSVVPKGAHATDSTCREVFTATKLVFDGTTARWELCALWMWLRAAKTGSEVTVVQHGAAADYAPLLASLTALRFVPRGIDLAAARIPASQPRSTPFVVSYNATLSRLGGCDATFLALRDLAAALPADGTSAHPLLVMLTASNGPSLYVDGACYASEGDLRKLMRDAHRAGHAGGLLDLSLGTATMFRQTLANTHLYTWHAEQRFYSTVVMIGLRGQRASHAPVVNTHHM